MHINSNDGTWIVQSTEFGKAQITISGGRVAQCDAVLRDTLREQGSVRAAFAALRERGDCAIYRQSKDARNFDPQMHPGDVAVPMKPTPREKPMIHSRDVVTHSTDGRHVYVKNRKGEVRRYDASRIQR